MMKIALEKSL